MRLRPGLAAKKCYDDMLPGEEKTIKELLKHLRDEGVVIDTVFAVNEQGSLLEALRRRKELTYIGNGLFRKD